MNEVYTALIPVAVDVLRGLIALVFSAIVLPWLVKTAIPWLKEKKMYEFIKKVVRAAEKLGESGTISKEAKLDYVIAVLQKNGIKVDATVRALIESAVGDLDDELTHGMMSLVDAINNADEASELFYSKGKVTTVEMDSRCDDDDEKDSEVVEENG